MDFDFHPSVRVATLPTPDLREQLKTKVFYFLSYTVADLHSKILGAPPPGPKFFQFHAVLGFFGRIVCWRPPPPPGELAAPPREILDSSLLYHTANVEILHKMFDNKKMSIWLVATVVWVSAIKVITHKLTPPPLCGQLSV